MTQKYRWQKAYMKVWDELFKMNQDWKGSKPTNKVQEAMRLSALHRIWSVMEIMETNMPKPAKRKRK